MKEFFPALWLTAIMFGAMVLAAQPLHHVADHISQTLSDALTVPR
jgi:hypothetical protein